MQYKEGMQFEKLKKGVLVEGIPIDHKIFDGYKQYIEPRRKSKSWVRNIKVMLMEMKDDYDFNPGYFCLNCNRVEDGSHRYDIAKHYTKINKFRLITGAICYKGVYGDLLNMFQKNMEKKNLLKKDFDWLEANALTKWNFLKYIIFENRTVLDVGTQTGFSALKARQRKAKKVVGYEIREEVLKVGIDLVKKLKLKNVKFINEDFFLSENNDKFDIVMCLGLLHYFKDDYLDRLDELLDRTKNKLILEIRCTDTAHKEPLVVGDQVIFTTGFVKKYAAENNLRIDLLIKRAKGRYMVALVKE